MCHQQLVACSYAQEPSPIAVGDESRGVHGNRVVRCELKIFFFQAEDGIRDVAVTGVQTCALPILSLAAAAAVTGTGLAVAVYGSPRWSAPLGGGIVGAGVACMHYTGMWAVELPGYVTWSLPLVVASVALGMLFGVFALAIAVRRNDLRGAYAAAALLTLAIVSHHFTAMGAVEIVPDPTRVITPFSLSPGSLAIAVASAAVAILGMSLVSAFADRRLDEKSRLLATALNNMTQGVVMFDAAGRLVVCNERYVAMYGLPPEIVKPGCTLEDIIRIRKSTGNFDGDPVQYCVDLLQMMAQGKTKTFVIENPDGRVIAVTNRPIAVGNYWIGTHDDITERRHAEAQSASLAEQQQRRASVDAAILSFRESVESVLGTVNDSVGAVRTTAMTLSASADETSKRAAGAGRTSSEASTNVRP